MPTLLRRLLSITGVAVFLPVALALTPVVLPLALLFDFATGRSDLPIVRLWLFGLVFVAHEWVVVPYSLVLWIRGGFGRDLDVDLHGRMQGRWIDSLLRWGRRLLRVEVRWPDLETVPAGRLIVISRHASMIDAILPAHLFAHQLDRPIHYVLKRELQWLPSIDIYGHRIGNHFVARGGDTDAEVRAISALAENARPNAAIAIFPEGTYATDQNRRRVRESLDRRGDDELVLLADELHQLLPPKSAGTIALMETSDADTIMVVGHVGMEGMAEVSGLRRHLPATRPVLVQWWLHHRSDLPVTSDDRIQWLRSRWRTLDRWVDDTRRVDPPEL